MTEASLHLQLGDIASWVGSIATSVALFLTYGLLRLTRREQRAQRDEERRDQARKISAWCERVDAAANEGPDDAHVMLLNDSEEPIYGVRLAVGSNWWSDPIEYEVLDLSYVIAPHHKELHTVQLRLWRTADGRPEPSPPVEIIFSDATGGRFWHRDRYGGLGEIIEQSVPASSDYFFKQPINSVTAPTGSGLRRRSAHGRAWPWPAARTSRQRRPR